MGEVFAATLCANNEHRPQDRAAGETGKKAVVRVRDVRVAAEILGPGSGAAGGGVPLELVGGEGERDGHELGEGETVQRVLKLSLREEGPHTLGVTVSYAEVEGEGGRSVVRTFRKLYQFVAMPLLGVRTKAGDVPKGKDGRVRYAVEAQLENVGDRIVVLEVSLLYYHFCNFIFLFLLQLWVMGVGADCGNAGRNAVSETTFQLDEPELGPFWHRHRSNAHSYFESKRCRASCFSARGTTEA